MYLGFYWLLGVTLEFEILSNIRKDIKKFCIKKKKFKL